MQIKTQKEMGLLTTTLNLTLNVLFILEQGFKSA